MCGCLRQGSSVGGWEDIVVGMDCDLRDYTYAPDLT